MRRPAPSGVGASLLAAASLLAVPAATALSTAPGAAAAQETRLLRHPTVSSTSVAFAHGGDLWVVPRSGGEARRLTATPEVEAEPRFSPDGSLIAFTATVAGNTDVYVVPAAGGEPTRLTWHPATDRARGWTPDGRRVLLASGRGTVPAPTPGVSSYFRLWTVDREGSFPEALALPRAFTGALSPDGSRVAYEEISTAFLPAWDATSQWRHYRGGRTHPIRIADLSDLSTDTPPWTESNDTDPMWLGETVYFLSDREGTVNLFAYETGTGELERISDHRDFDIMSASAGAGAVVYEQAGRIHLLDAGTGEARPLSIRVRGDFPWARPRWVDVSDAIRDAALSPTGVRAAFEARGDIFTVPAAGEGDVRNLTRSPGTHERSPAWSPDGTRLAWLSDASGEYRLVIGDQTGLGTPHAIALPSTAFFAEPAWSPDGERLLLRDNHLNLWLVEVEGGGAHRIDTDTYHTPGRGFDAVWSPDGRWVAYSKSLTNHQRAVFLYSVEEDAAHRITDGMADAVSPAFDASGAYLWFLASTDYGLSRAWLEMSSLDRPVTRSIYLVVLDADRPSPLLPRTGDEPGAVPDAERTAGAAGAAAPQRTAEAGAGAATAVEVDLEEIGQRILSLDLESADLRDLKAGPPGTIFYVEGGEEGPASGELRAFHLEGGEATTHLPGVVSYTLSADGRNLLYRGGGNAWGVVPTAEPAEPGQGRLDLGGLQARIDPAAEWPHIFREAWRLQRQYFYDPEMHGADWGAVYERYRPLVEHVRHRDDLSYLIATVGGELAVGHSYITGPGDVPGGEPVSVGMLGADLAVEEGRYRIERIYRGENWNPDLRAPLSAPGIDVEEGDFLLAVNGRPLDAPANPYAPFEGTAGRQTLIRVNDRPTTEGSRVVTVVPVAGEAALRTRAWVEGNRRRVDSLSAGRLGYVWLPNTATPGYEYFNRYYYAQQDRQGVVIDERYNQGGMVADYIVDELAREPMGWFATRAGDGVPSPLAGVYGPKVMVINESAGSGGDALPYYFRLRGLGPLVGTRTWGALVGTLAIPPTLDGGGITAPALAFYDFEGRWAVENEGVPPDIEVEQTPSEVARGRDPQLDRAVAEALDLLDGAPAQTVGRPPPPDRTWGGSGPDTP